MKKFFDDFKAFAMKGNVIDLAVGVVIGGAFGKIVTSLVEDIITPVISMLLDTSEMASWAIVIGSTAEGQEVFFRYGAFIQNVINFLIISFSIFVVVRLISKVHIRHEEEKQVEVKKSDEVVLLEEIRDLLKKQ